MTEEEKLRKIAELRALLDRRVEEMRIELEGLRALLEFANSMLLKKGFKRAEVAAAEEKGSEGQPTPPSPPSIQAEAPSVVEHEKPVPIRTVTGDLLASLYFGADSIRVVMAEDKQFTMDIPPFRTFLMERVLTKMQDKDRDAVSIGEIEPEKVLSYNILRDGDVIRELTVRNVASDRARELKSAIRWTLEKMYEKMKSA